MFFKIIWLLHCSKIEKSVFSSELFWSNAACESYITIIILRKCISSIITIACVFLKEKKEKKEYKIFFHEGDFCWIRPFSFFISVAILDRYI